MTPEDDRIDEISRTVRAERARRRWTQKELAEKSMVSRATVIRAEHGQSISTANLCRIVATLKLKITLLQDD